MNIISNVPKVLLFKTTYMYAVYLFSEYAYNFQFSISIILNNFNVWQYNFRLKSYLAYIANLAYFSLYHLWTVNLLCC